MKRTVKKSKPAARTKSGQHCVFDKKTGKKVACYTSLSAARAHLARLNGVKKKSSCGCGS